MALDTGAPPIRGVAVAAQQEIEEEAGGPFESAAITSYVALTNVARATCISRARSR